MYFQGVVFDPSSAGTADSSTATANFGRANDLIVSQLHGKYLQQAYRGNVYYASTATAGVVIPIAVTTTQTPTFTIWNPAGSGKLLVPIVTLIGWTVTTAALGTFIWQACTGAGSSISSTAPITAFGTLTAPTNANLGSGKVSAMKFAAAGTTTILTGASSYYRGTGISTCASTAASAVSWWVARDDWEGTGIIPPGNAIWLAGTTAIAVTATVTLVYAEIPL